MQRLIDANKIEYDKTPMASIHYVLKDSIDSVPTVEAIPKADYENRLKADMVAMLTDIQLEIEEQCKIPNNCASAYDWTNGVYACYKVIQQKIDALKADVEPQKSEG